MNPDFPWPTILAVYAFIWGALWGSFLNVVIWRVPRGESVVNPPSHCPACDTQLAWYDNIPLVSWLWLRAKCRYCGVHIPARYPLVELLVALLSLALWHHVADGKVFTEPIQVVVMQFLLLFYFALACVAIGFIDLDTTYIPLVLTIPTTLWGVLAGVISPKEGKWTHFFPGIDLFDSLLGLAIGAGVIIFVMVGYRVVRGHEGMGEGDVAMMAMIGANLGPMSIPFVLMFSSFQGVLVAVGVALYERVFPDPERESLLLQGAHTEEFWEDKEKALSGEVPEAQADASEREAEDSASASDDSADPSQGADISDQGPAAPTEDTADDSEDEEFLKAALPFGPFLALAAIEYVFFGRAFISWLTAGLYP